MITLDYTPELYESICMDYGDYHQTGYTVCGAQDPAVIYLGEYIGKKHPELAKYTVVRIIDKYLNEWNSATLLEFSNKDITDEEYKLYDDLVQEEEDYEFLHSFQYKLAEMDGDKFFTSGDIKKDIEMIKSTIKNQGFWAGTRYKYFYDEDFRFLRVEERKFGA